VGFWALAVLEKIGATWVFGVTVLEKNRSLHHGKWQ